MSSYRPFEYPYNPQWNTYHAQAFDNAPARPSSTAPYAIPSSHEPSRTRHRPEVGTCEPYIQPPRARRDSSEVILYPPGAVEYISSPKPPITPQWVLQNPGRSWCPEAPPLMKIQYLPRIPTHSCYTSEEIINFTSRGLPGPYLSVILSENPGLDGADDKVFVRNGWKRTQWLFDFPGIPLSSPKRMPVADSAARWNISRLELARNICTGIQNTMQAFQGYLAYNFMQLRLVALVFHGSSWIPVLAVDVA